MGEGQSLHRGLLLSLIVIGALVLAAAALFARSLTRPLRLLADAAPGIVVANPRHRRRASPATKSSNCSAPWPMPPNAPARRRATANSSVARVAALHGGGLTLRNRDGGGLEAVLRLRATAP